MKKVLVKDAFNEIAKLTGYHFLYEESALKDIAPVDIDIKDSLDNLLADITSQTGLYFKKTDKTISVSRGGTSVKNVSQQKKIIAGTIVDDLNIPLIGVSIVEKGVSNGVITDVDGNFSIEVNENSTLIISYIGFQSQEVKVKGVGNTRITIQLEKDTNILDEVVVVGYGTQKKVNLTGAVASVDYSKEATSRPLVGAAQALGGLAPGLQVMQGTGNPYGESFSINIRGQGTLNNSNPLILVDGMEQSLNNVNPIDIETISILKDAASCAIYGYRGANGVILITTKTKGKQDKVNVEVSSSLSLNSPMRVPKLVNNYADYMELINESYLNLGRSEAFTSATIDLWREKEKDPNGISESGYPNYVAYPNTDWYDAIYDSQWMQNHTI